MTLYERKQINEERNQMAFDLLNVYGDRAKALFEHLTGRRDLRTGNIFTLSFILGIMKKRPGQGT